MTTQSVSFSFALRRIALTTGILFVLWSGLGGSPHLASARAEPDSLDTPTHNFLMTGYATVDYETTVSAPYRHDFGVLFAPVTLYQVGPSFLFEGEMDLELEGGTTNLTLEHAQIHYLADRFQLTAGQFHVPLGLWMHQDWIHRMPSPPLLYGHAHDGVADRALLPIPFDVGVMGKSRTSIGGGWSLRGRLWVTQGPRTASGEAENHHHGSESGETDHHEEAPSSDPADGGNHDHGHEKTFEIPIPAYGINHRDNNGNKMIGGRLTLMNRRWVRVHVAGWHATYDRNGELGTRAGNFSVLLQPGSWDLRGEGILIQQEVLAHEEETSFGRGGYYLQAARRFGRLEPVVRWSHLPDATFEHQTVQHTQRQLALGLNYWIRASMPFKLAYQWELDEHPDRILLAWTIGF